MQLLGYINFAEFVVRLWFQSHHQSTVCKNKCPETEDWIRIQDNVWKGKASQHTVFPFPLVKRHQRLFLIMTQFEQTCTCMSLISASIVYLLRSCENFHADNGLILLFFSYCLKLNNHSGTCEWQNRITMIASQDTNVCLFALKCWFRPLFLP